MYIIIYIIIIFEILIFVFGILRTIKVKTHIILINDVSL